MSEMVVNSLSAHVPTETTPALCDRFDDDGDIVDPNNPKIVTTAAERKLLGIVRDLLSNEPLHGKDTESYYTVLYQNKVNRWLLRYCGDRRRPTVQFCIPLTAQHLTEVQRAGLESGVGGLVMLDKPEHLMRVPGLLFDALAFCKDDGNFRLKKPE